MVDFLVVGLGLAGVSICEHLERRGFSYCVIDHGREAASNVSGGTYNPVVLKRYKKVWNAGVFLEHCQPFYRELESKLGLQIHEEIPLYRRFSSPSEHNAWMEAADNPSLQPYLQPEILNKEFPGIDTPNGVGLVKGTGRIDAPLLLKAFIREQLKNGKLLEEHFDFDQLQTGQKELRYKDIRAHKLILATGMGIKADPFFKHLPVEGNKGEYLLVSCPDLDPNQIIKGSFFLIPQGKGIFKFGATYDRKDQGSAITIHSRKTLEGKLRVLLKCPFEVIGQEAGIRPTVPDRRPLLGSHPEFPNIFCLNGLGSRGVLMAPYLASHLLDHIIHGRSLLREIDLARYPL